MAEAKTVSIDVSDVRLHRSDGREVVLGDLPGVQVLVLVRHRH